MKKAYLPITIFLALYALPLGSLKAQTLGEEVMLANAPSDQQNIALADIDGDLDYLVAKALPQIVS